MLIIINIIFSYGFTGRGWKYLLLQQSKVDHLIDAARKEKEGGRRKDLYAEAQEIELSDTPYIPVRVIENVAAVSKEVKGFSISPSGYLEINDITLK